MSDHRGVVLRVPGKVELVQWEKEEWLLASMIGCKFFYRKNKDKFKEYESPESFIRWFRSKIVLNVDHTTIGPRYYISYPSFDPEDMHTPEEAIMYMLLAGKTELVMQCVRELDGSFTDLGDLPHSSSKKIEKCLFFTLASRIVKVTDTDILLLRTILSHDFVLVVRGKKYPVKLVKELISGYHDTDDYSEENYYRDERIHAFLFIKRVSELVRKRVKNACVTLSLIQRHPQCAHPLPKDLMRYLLQCVLCTTSEAVWLSQMVLVLKK